MINTVMEATEAVRIAADHNHFPRRLVCWRKGYIQIRKLGRYSGSTYAVLPHAWVSVMDNRRL